MCNKQENSICSGSTKLIFSCSGAADVAYIADQAARKMMREGDGKMYCLAGLGGNIPGIIETTKKADKLLVIDGCPVACSKNIMKQTGFQDYEYIEVTEMGFEKGKTPFSDEAVNKVAEKGREVLS